VSVEATSFAVQSRLSAARRSLGRI